MKRRIHMILENARKRRRDDEKENTVIRLETTTNKNNSSNTNFIENMPDREVIVPRRLNLITTDRRILSPVKILADESDSECNDSLPPQVLVRSSSVSSSSSSSSSSSDSSSSSSSSVSSISSGTHKNNDSTDLGPITINETPYARSAKQTVTSYCISPVNEYESDPDLSDDDPTFKVDRNQLEPQLKFSDNSEPQPSGSGLNLQRRPPSDESPQSSGNGIISQSHSVDQEPPPSDAANRRPKKRPRNTSNWKQNIAKKLRNTGQAYTSLSKSKKEVPARSIKEPCACRLKCPENIDETHRKSLFDSFWELGSIELQRMFIKSCMMEINPKYKYSNTEKPRAPNNAFYFYVEGNKIRVCKKYFINTLDITDRQIRTVKEKSNNNGFVNEEQRGKHDHRKTTDKNDIQEIEAHIKSIPRIPSHYIRANSERDYIVGGKTIKDLWRDFSKIREDQNKPQLPYWLYHNIFTTKFNISFFQPKKDKCDTCLKYDLSTPREKETLQDSYDMHLTERTLCRLDKKVDRSNINEQNICVVYDLQAVMQCPTGETSSFYYVSKLNCLNFTIAELSQKTLGGSDNSESEDLGAYGNVYCYFWDETQARRGSNEIGSCVYDYLKDVSQKLSDKTLDIIFYSDNCAGQNKNKFITCLYAYALANLPNIRSITHKFFITGHTQSEGDNVHSLIEKEIKKSLKAGPIYSPHEYISLIKSAKKNGVPFKVKELSYDSVIDLKPLAKEWGYNFNEDDDDREHIAWSDIKVLRFLKNDPFVFRYKTSYTQDNYRLINMRNKRTKLPGVAEIVAKPAYQERLKLSQNTIKGLKDLLRKKLIPTYYIDYYSSITE